MLVKVLYKNDRIFKKLLIYRFKCNHEGCSFEATVVDTIRMHVKEHYDSSTIDQAMQRKRFREKKSKLKHQKQGHVKDAISVKIEGENGGDEQAVFGTDNSIAFGNTDLESKLSRKKTPLTIYERTNYNPEQHLCESQNTQNELSSFPQLKQELDLQNQLLQQMPNVTENLQTSIMWDVILLQLESTKFTFGIPGECVCFICNTALRTVPEKHLHQVLLHGGGPQSESFKCSSCIKYFSSEEAAFDHVKSQHQDLFIQEKRNEQTQPIVKTFENNSHQVCTAPECFTKALRRLNSSVSLPSPSV